MSNLKQDIVDRNKSILHKTIVPPKTCNCRKPLQESILYQVTVLTENNPTQAYLGLTKNPFKTR